LNNGNSPQTPTRPRSKRYLKAAVIFAGVFILCVMLWSYAPVFGSNDSAFCARCHSMAPEYMTWQYSSHAQFDCKSCHKQPGAAGFFQFQAKILKEIFVYGNQDSTITKQISPVPDSVCLNCHSENRNYSPSSDNIIPHRVHTAKGVTCVTCHAGIAHGRIVERGVTAEYAAEQWNYSLTGEQMDHRNVTPRMSVCLDCHGKRQVNQTCSACHSRQVIPETHKAPGWDRQHGISAQKDFKPCNLCHSYSFDKSKNLTSLNVQGYIKNNTFCFNCHLQKPGTHKNLKFREEHGQLANSRGFDNCFSCHNVNKNDSTSNKGAVNKVYCNQCHWFTESAVKPLASAMGI
jgi:hypothetical protein